jgi:hypothetical protein
MGEAIGTTEEWKNFVQELREQFQIFSTKDLTAATAKVVLLTRELGFTRDQTEEVVRASIILSEVTGVKVEEAARRLTLFLDTGYSRGLALLGLQVNRTTVEQSEFAEELDKTWNEMSRGERASVGLAEVLKQVEALQEDAGRAAETFQGRMMALEAAQSDAMIEVGENAASLKLIWETIKTFIVTDVAPALTGAIEFVVKAFGRGLAAFLSIWIGVAGGIASVINGLKTGVLPTIGDIVSDAVKAGIESFNQLTNYFDDTFFPKLTELGNVSEEEMGSLADNLEEGAEEAEDLADTIAKFVDKIEDEFRRFGRAQEDAFRRFQQNMEDLERDFLRDQLDAQRDLVRKLEDIDRKSLERRQDLITDSRRREQEIWARANEDIAQAQIQFRFEEIRDQRRFNLEMAQLQREFLFALEDAVRERDARQVLMLIRRNNLERQRRQEDFDNRQIERAAELQLEIQQIRRAAQIRINEERRALAQRLADEEQARKRRREAAKEDFQRDLEDLAIQHQRRREEEMRDYERRLEDLAIFHNRKLTDIGRALAREVGVNAQAAQAIVSVWANAAQQLLLLRTFMQGFASEFSAGGVTADASRVGSVRGGGGAGFFAFQEGGQMIARKPTLAMFGEGGPELGSFVPLNRMNQMGAGMPGGRIGIDVTVSAEDGFRADVSESVMNDVADVLTVTERESGR